MTRRICIAESVMQKAGAFGLQEHAPQLARLLKQMVRGSAVASRNRYVSRRRFGAFVLTMAGGTLVDINTNSDDEICITCLGVGFISTGEDCGSCFGASVTV